MLRPRLHGKAIVPFQNRNVHTGMERRRIGLCFFSHRKRNHSVTNLVCSLENGTMTYRALLLFTLEPKSLRSTLFSLVFAIFLAKLHPHMHTGQKSHRLDFWTSSTSHCLITWERSGMIAYCSTFWITFSIVPHFGTERCYLQRPHENPISERSIFRNGKIRNDCVYVGTGPKFSHLTIVCRSHQLNIKT